MFHVLGRERRTRWPERGWRRRSATDGPSWWRNERRGSLRRGYYPVRGYGTNGSVWVTDTLLYTVAPPLPDPRRKGPVGRAKKRAWWRRGSGGVILRVHPLRDPFATSANFHWTIEKHQSSSRATEE